ncbi:MULTISPECIES: hypothetical protein [Exiguobacterium]|uniref:Cobalt transport protein n=1 Tax=Exiguobacterium antarcticum TaxID=132920 RepID=A0ABT6R3G2_9BACL|nr:MULTISPECIES: hypothetical protein [Exiguobacterium]AFS70067.1 Hypothetical protein Eab7_0925 [Exiguobacterium antarcticum B7]MCT4779463.1 hypothetical protein [Exiguobacterium soli]MDI3235360.1 hypothetical protein [Exiguobacterium antarcticum]
MQWLIFSKAERERLHPLNVALFVVAMLSVPFFLHTHLSMLLLLVGHVLFFIWLRQWGIFRYLWLPLIYIGMMYFPLLGGGAVDSYGIWLTGLKVAVFVTSSQLTFTLVRLEQMGPLFRILPRLTRLTGMVLAILPSLLRTWPEVKMSHPNQPLAVKMERVALYHLLPIEAVPSGLRHFNRADFFMGLLIGILFLLMRTPLAPGAAAFLPVLLIFSKGGMRDAYYHYKRKRLA